MDIEELQNEIERDFKIDDALLDIESLKTPQLHSKYMKHYTKFKLMLTKAETDYKQLKRHKWEYYTGKSDAQVYAEKPFDLKILRTDVDKYIESDDELIRGKQKIEYLSACVDYLDRTIRQISNRTFTIKNAIDWRRFTSGAV